MTGAFGKGCDPRTLPDWSPAITAAVRQAHGAPSLSRGGDGTYRTRLAALAADEGCGFLDLDGAWGAYLLATDRPYAWFMRDEVHANARGAQLLARVLERFFAPGPRWGRRERTR